MNIEAYISSGILESYVLGMCSDEEVREVESMLVKHPEIRAELASIEDALNAYARMHSKSPDRNLREKVISRLSAPSQPALKVVHRAQNEIRTSSDTRYRVAVAASLLLFAFSFITNLVLYNRYKSANEQLSALNAEKTLLSETFKANQAKYDAMKSEMTIMADPAVSRVMLKGVEKSPSSMAVVYWNRSTNEVYLEVKDLPAPAAGKDYQLWAIVDGAPVDAGMLRASAPSDSSLHKMKSFPSAQAFAITLEAEGGSPVPTMNEMYVMGAVSL